VLVHATFNLPVSVFLYMNQLIRALPRDLDEAALIGGCSVYTIFSRIILPLLRLPVLAVFPAEAGYTGHRPVGNRCCINT